MKITQLKTFLLNSGQRMNSMTGYGPNWVFVKIYTDEGPTGLGEAFPTGKARTTEAALHEYERWLVGKDPTHILHHWQAYYVGSRYPLGAATMGALSAVEQALWDIAGKSCGLPVYKMLGGPTRERIRLYASGRYLNTTSSLVESARQAVDAGFTAIKFAPHPQGYASKTFETVLEESVERVRAVRNEVGLGVGIALDYHGRSLGPSQAVLLARAVEPFKPMFLEEPALTEYPESTAEVKAKTVIPIATGERCISRNRFRAILENRAAHILQPEPTVYGGILETVKLAATAEMFDVSVAPHQAGSPVSLLVCAHIDAAITNFLIQECNVLLDAPMAQELFTSLPLIKNGDLILPDTPGLGIDLNEEAAKAYPYKPFDRKVVPNRDGSIGLM